MDVVMGLWMVVIISELVRVINGDSRKTLGYILNGVAMLLMGWTKIGKVG